VRRARPIADLAALAWGPASSLGHPLRLCWEDETVELRAEAHALALDEPVWTAMCASARARQLATDAIAYQWRQLLRVDLPVRSYA
jgi:hypothetical protein